MTINASSLGHALDGKNVGKLILINGATANISYIINTEIDADATSTLTTK